MYLYILCLVISSTAGIYSNVVSPFEFDEVFTGSMACQSSLSETLRLSKWDLHPVLYLGFIHYVFQVAGCHLWLIRGISLACSLIGSILIIWRTYKLGGNGLFMLAILLGSPAFWFQSFEARSYAMLYLATCGIIFFSLSESQSQKIYAVPIALIGAMLNYFAIYLFVFSVTVNYIADRRFTLSRRFVAANLSCAIAIFLYYYFQVGTAYGVSRHVIWSGAGSQTRLVLDTLEYFFGPLAAILILFMAAMVMFRRTDDRLIRNISLVMILDVIFLFLIFDVSSLLYRPTFSPRYLYFLLPVIAVPFGLLDRGSETRKPTMVTAQQQQVIWLLSLFLMIDAITMATVGRHSRSGIGTEATDNMVCTLEHPCAFAVSPDYHYSSTDEQFGEMVNFSRKLPEKFVMMRSPELAGWMKSVPGGQFVWLGAGSEINLASVQSEIEGLARRYSLMCKKSDDAGLSELVCTISR